MTNDIYLCARGKNPMPDEPTQEEIQAFCALKAFVKWSAENPSEDNLPVVELMLSMAYDSGKNSLVVTPDDARRMIDEIVIPYVQSTANKPISSFLMEGIAKKVMGWLRTL